MLSPLRYPGGKAKLFQFFVQLLRHNDAYELTYCEPYAGGAGLALKLLSHGYVKSIELNDLDPAIYSFWKSVVFNADEFCLLVRDVSLTVEEWQTQRNIYNSGIDAGELALGFSAFYLNRTSRSGIIEGAGPIGGYSQTGNWKIDARFNREALTSQIQEISRFAPAIKVSCQDALVYAAKTLSKRNRLTYLDPPYFVKGHKLYKNFYTPDDHAKIADLLRQHKAGSWVLSYDFVPSILKLYEDFQATYYDLQYSAGRAGSGRELIFSGDSIELPIFEGFQQVA